MGLTDQEIVALSGAHTLGRSRPSRSGWGKESTPYTEKGPGLPGGQSWTQNWLTFDNRRAAITAHRRPLPPLSPPPPLASSEHSARWHTRAHTYTPP